MLKKNTKDEEKITNDNIDNIEIPQSNTPKDNYINELENINMVSTIIPEYLETNSINEISDIVNTINENDVVINIYEDDIEEEQDAYDIFKRKIHDNKWRELYRVNIMDYYREFLNIVKDHIKRLEINVEKKSESIFDKINKNPNKNPDVEYILPRLKTLNQDLVKAYKNTKNIDLKNVFNDILYNKKYGLENVIGRKDVKNEIAMKILLMATDKPGNYISSFNNIALLGPSGVGKSYLANTISYALSKSGILLNDKVIIIDKNSFVSAYVDNSGNQATDTFSQSLGGIVFIDEAYNMAPNPMNEKGGGNDSITAIVRLLDLYKGLNIMIVAGYEDRMINEFFESNEGLYRRFPNIIVMDNYTDTDLTIIAVKKLEVNNKLSEDNIKTLNSVIKTLNVDNKLPFQGGSIEILIDRINDMRRMRLIHNNGDKNLNNSDIIKGTQKYLNQYA